VINPSDRDVLARVSAGAERTHVVDVIDESVFDVRSGTLEIRMKPRTARMLAIG